MPRLLPRLVKELAHHNPAAAIDRANAERFKALDRPKKKSLHKPVPPFPSFFPSDYPTSILLDPVNPIANAHDYTRHKTLPPAVRLHRRPTPIESPQDQWKDQTREMTEHERKWWSSPYSMYAHIQYYLLIILLMSRYTVRMLSSPMRTCILTQRRVPTGKPQLDRWYPGSPSTQDFMIRVAPMRLPKSRLNPKAPLITLIPDGLQHPKFRVRKSGKSAYIICWKGAIEETAQRGRYMTLSLCTQKKKTSITNTLPGSYQRIAPRMEMHPHLTKQIVHLLRVRVLQELELLIEEVESRPQGTGDSPVIRRLTRAEWKNIQSSGIIPYENAIAVLVVPPLNRNPITKTRPEPSLSTVPIPEDVEPSPPSSSRPLPPLSVLHPMQEPVASAPLPNIIPPALTPLYNGLTLFPSRPQRAALHASLTRLLFLERRARYKQHVPPTAEDRNTDQPEQDVDKWARGDKKASHAFLLCSDSETVKRADVAALAIALWRVRMFEGGGWESDLRNFIWTPQLV